MAADFTTPERALASLENAYVRKDVEGAVAAKDFRFEATAMLKNLHDPSLLDEETIRKTTEVLELSFRTEMKTKGFPDFKDLHCKVVRTSHLEPTVVEMIEECVWSDGGKSRDVVHATKGASGWRIVVLPGKS